MARDKHWLNIVECPRMELIISHTSTLKPASPTFLISVKTPALIHSVIQTRSFAVFLYFPNLSCFHTTLTSSCWVCLDCKARNALYPTHLSGMCLQPATLRTKSRLAYHVKAIESPSSMLLRCNPTHCLHSIHLDPSMSPLWDLQAKGTAPATCCAVNPLTQKSCVFLQHSWNRNKLMY